MAAAKVEIIYEAEATRLKATVNEVNKANDAVVESAKKSATAISEAYKGAYKNSEKAFKSDFIEKAIKGQITLVQTLGKAGTALKPLSNSLDETGKRLKIVVESEDDIRKLEERLRKLSLEGKRGTEEFKDIAKAIGEYKSAIIAADRAVDLYAKSTDAATGRIGELEDKLYDLALAGQTNTQEFNDLIREVSSVKRAIAETDAQVDALSKRGAKLTSFVQSIELVGVAFQAVEGAAALSGEENKDLEKTLVKLNAIMAITSALEQGRALIMEQIAAKTGIAGVAMKAYTFVTNGAATATKVWRGLLVATGIGALVAILATLASKFMDNSEATKEAAEAAKEYQKSIDQLNISAQQSQTKAANAQIELLQKQGKIREDVAKKLIANNELQSQLSDLAIEAKDKETEAFKRFEEQKLADVKDFGKVTQTTKDQLFKELSTIESERSNKEKEIRAKTEVAIIDINKDAKQKQKEIDQKAAQDRLKIIEETIKKEILIDGESQKERIDLATNLAEQEKLNANQSIKNLELRAATIARIEQELANNIEAIKLDERRKANETRILELEAIQSAGKLEIDQAIELAKARVEAEKIAAGGETDPAKRKALEAKAEADGEAAIKKIKADGFQADVQLFTARLQLQQELGDFSVATQKKLVEVEFKGKEAALIAAADQTVEGQKKLTQDLLKLKADERKALDDIDKNAVDKAIELEILRIETLEALGKATFQDKKNLINEELKLKINAIDKELVSEEEKEKKRALARAEANGEIKALDQELTQEILDLANASADAFGAILDLQKQVSENRIADIEQVRDTEIAAIEKSTDSERKKQDKIAAANLRAQQRIKAEKTKQAQADKAIAVFEAIIGTAAAVASAKTIPLKVLAGIIGATQLAIILAQPIPKFKKGGIVGGRSHEAGGTMIEAEKGEFIVNKSSVARHRDALDAMNRSSSAFKKYVDERYVRPALMDFATKNRGANVTVNASLNSKSMEREIKGLRKDLKGKSTVININSSDSRYQWQ
jgi:hypothetical protein